MELLNHVAKFDDMSDQGRAVRHEALQAMVLLLNPVTPHVCHGLWQALGHAETLLEDVPFPKADPDALKRDALTLAVQVNGKLRGTIEVAPDTPKEVVEAAALAEPAVARFLEGQTVRKVIVVPGQDREHRGVGLIARAGGLAGRRPLVQTARHANASARLSDPRCCWR